MFFYIILIIMLSMLLVGNNLWLRQLKGKLLQVLAPGYGYGYCYRCYTPWKFTKGYTTFYAEYQGCCSPLCEKCWSELTPEERLPYYEKLWNTWHTFGKEYGPNPKDWDLIKKQF